MRAELAGVTLGGRYTLLRGIGRGGFATVYAAFDAVHGEEVAVKVLHARYAAVDDPRRRFVQEARALARLRHPQLVEIRDHGVSEDGTFYIVMELLRGSSLSQWLKAHPGPRPWREVFGFAAELAEILAFVHRQGVVHRDIKPANIFVLESQPASGSSPVPLSAAPIKLLDLGIAKLCDEFADSDAPRTRESQMAPGTPGYMAPEQILFGAKGPSIDLYALGVVIYRLLSGTPPFAGDEGCVLTYKHVHDTPDDPRLRAPEAELPEVVATLALRLLAKRPDDRFASANDLREAVLTLLHADIPRIRRRPRLQHRGRPPSLGNPANPPAQGATTTAGDRAHPAPQAIAGGARGTMRGGAPTRAVTSPEVAPPLRVVAPLPAATSGRGDPDASSPQRSQDAARRPAENENENENENEKITPDLARILGDSQVDTSLWFSPAERPTVIVAPPPREDATTALLSDPFSSPYSKPAPFPVTGGDPHARARPRGVADLAESLGEVMAPAFIATSRVRPPPAPLPRVVPPPTKTFIAQEEDAQAILPEDPQGRPRGRDPRQILFRMVANLCKLIFATIIFMILSLLIPSPGGAQPPQPRGLATLD